MARIATRIELAFGADLTADSATWTWTDVSTYALGSVSVTFGRADEASTTQPATCRFRLRNTDARFSPRFPTSPYYPYVRRQTPVRVSLNPGGTGYVQRFQGYIDQFTPTWPTDRAGYAEMSIVASGSLRRLGQGSTPLKSPLRRALATSGAFAYWPLEEGPAADSLTSLNAAAATSLVPPSAPGSATTGPPEPGAVRPITGTSAMPSFIRGGALDLRVGSTVSSAWSVEFALFFGTGEPAPADYGTPNAMNVLKLYAFNGDYWLFQLSPHNAVYTGGRIALFRSDEPELFFDTLVDNTIGSFNPWDGQTHHVAITASQSGGNIAWQLFLDGVIFSSGTLVGRTLQAIELARLNQNGFLASSSTYGLGHFAAFESVVNPATRATAALGHATETAGARITRLCAEQGVTVSVSSTTGTTRMGPQTAATFLSLLRECEAADGGILYDGTSAGLVYLARQDRYNLAVTLALGASRAQVRLPFAPTEDDQRVRNDWTVSRPSGSSAQFTDPTHIAANGLYDDSKTLNTATDNGLIDQAAWGVHLGTVEEMRVPGLSLQLINHSELWTAWLSITPGKRATVDNVFAQYPPGTLDTIIEGYAEAWDPANWQIELNTSPARPWQVAVLEDTEFGRLDSADTTLLHALTAGATSGRLAIGGHEKTATVWTTVDGTYDWRVAGERMTVTSVTSAAATLVNAGTASHGDNATLAPALPASVQLGDLLLVAAAIRNTSATITTPTGYTLLKSGTNVALFGKIHTGSESAPSVAFSGGAAGDTTSAQMAALRNTQLVVHNSASTTNVAAANITTPALAIYRDSCAVLVFGWRQDDWTSVATLAGFTEIGEPSSTIGNDQGFVWDYVIQTTATDIAATAFVVTGGTNAIGASLAVALLTDVQTFTATRAVNGVTKAQAAGEQASLWSPMILAL